MALAEVMADDIEWVDPGDPDDDPNAGTFRGKEAVLRWFSGLAATLDYTTFEPREFIAQNDTVVSLVYSEATVRDTGRAFVNPEAHVWTIRDGKLARFQSYQTPQRRLLPTAWRSPRGEPADRMWGEHGGQQRPLAWASVLSPEN